MQGQGPARRVSSRVSSGRGPGHPVAPERPEEGRDLMQSKSRLCSPPKTLPCARVCVCGVGGLASPCAAPAQFRGRRPPEAGRRGGGQRADTPQFSTAPLLFWEFLLRTQRKAGATTGLLVLCGRDDCCPPVCPCRRSSRARPVSWYVIHKQLLEQPRHRGVNRRLSDGLAGHAAKLQSEPGCGLTCSCSVAVSLCPALPMCDAGAPGRGRQTRPETPSCCPPPIQHGPATLRALCASHEVPLKSPTCYPGQQGWHPEQ